MRTNLNARLLTTLAAIGLAFTSTAAHAALLIDPGNIELLPNTAGQQVQLFVTGDDLVVGFELDLQINDGGADLGGSDTGPVIESIDLITDTVFNIAGATQADPVQFDLAAQSTVDAPSEVLTNGLIATITFSTVGLAPDSQHVLLLTGVAGTFDTKFFDSQAQVVSGTVRNGTITILPVPEPAMLGLATVGVCLLGRRRRQALP